MRWMRTRGWGDNQKLADPWDIWSVTVLFSKSAVPQAVNPVCLLDSVSKVLYSEICVPLRVCSHVSTRGVWVLVKREAWRSPLLALRNLKRFQVLNPITCSILTFSQLGLCVHLLLYNIRTNGLLSPSKVPTCFKHFWLKILSYSTSHSPRIGSQLVMPSLVSLAVQGF